MQRGLDLFFRGERDYLQGSLLLSQAAAACDAEAVAAGAPRPRALERADFRAIARAHCVVSDAAVAPGAKAKASFRLRYADGSTRAFRVDEDPARPAPPARVADRPSLLESFEPTGSLACKMRLRPLASFDDLMAGLVLLGRTLYVHEYPGARDPSILSFFDTALPLDPAPFAGGASLVSEREGVRRSGPRTVTAIRVRLEGEGAPPIALRMLGACEEAS